MRSSKKKHQWNQFNQLLEKYSLWADSDVLKDDDCSVSNIECCSHVVSDILLKQNSAIKIAKSVNGLLLRSDKRKSRSSSTSNSPSAKSDDVCKENVKIPRVRRKTESPSTKSDDRRKENIEIPHVRRKTDSGSSSGKSDNRCKEYMEILRVKRKIESELKSHLRSTMEKRVKYMNSNDTDNFRIYDKKLKVEIKRLEKYVSDTEFTLYFKYLFYKTVKE